MKKVLVFWFTGLSGSGKTTIANETAQLFLKRNKKVKLFDGDVIREKVNKHLSFSPGDIRENNKIMAELCVKDNADCDYIFVTAISPFEDSRGMARRIVGDCLYFVYVKASLNEVVKRDPKGLYRKALSGEIKYFIGIDKNVPYHVPKHPDLVLDTEKEDIKACIDRLTQFINIKEAERLNKFNIIIVDATKFTLTSFFSKALDFFTAIVIRRILGPMSMGVFSQLMLVFQYSKYYHLGIYEALDREIPYYNGRREYAKAEKIKEAGFNFGFLAALLVGISLFLSSYFLRIDKMLTVGLKFIAVLVVIQSITTYFTIVARTHHRFTFLSRYNIVIAVITTLVTLYLTLNFGFHGVLWAYVLVAFSEILYFIRNGFRLKVRIKIPLKLAVGLFKIGLPILFYGVTFVTLNNVDKFMIITFFGKEQLGYYSVATMMSGYLVLLPNILYTVLFPRFYEAFGREGDIRGLKHHFLTPTYIIAYLLPLIIGFTILVLPILIKYFLRQYSAGLLPAYILVTGTFFVSITGMSSYLLIALNKQAHLIIIGFICIGSSVLLNYFFIKKLAFGLTGVALAALFTFLLYSILMISYALSNYTKRISEHIVLLLKLYFPIIWVSLLSFWLVRYFDARALSPAKDIASFLTRAALLLFLYSPLLYYINKKTGIINDFFRLLNVANFGIKK